MEEWFYEGREQSLVKHKMLRDYVIKFALIVSKHWRSITYVDCFTGPWESQSDSYEDTSFAIALQQLRKARDARIKTDENLELRAIFVEHDPKAFAELQRFVAKVTDVEILPINERFEDSISQIIEFINSSKLESFPFIFIDPTGWTGFALDRIRPLLNLKNCDVLINFMTKDIIRFIENEDSYDSFHDLFGSGEFREELRGKEGEDRVDAAVFKYRDVVSKVGHFDYPGVSTVLNPKKIARTST